MITNIVKNATESIETAFSDKILKRESDVGKIYIAIEQKHDCYNITISDNGIGLPKTGRHKLLEPYMTTRSKGTGLGLAIVKHIMEEHLGSIYLGDAAPTIGYDHGAKITLSFPVLAEDTNEVTGVEDGG